MSTCGKSICWLLCISVITAVESQVLDAQSPVSDRSAAKVDVADQLANMRDKHPKADANGDGKLTEDEAGRYIRYGEGQEEFYDNASDPRAQRSRLCR